MFNVGDRVVRIRINELEKDSNYKYGTKATITELDAMEPGVDCMVLTDIGIRTLWNYEYMILEEIYESPLYKAMRENEM